MFPLETLLHRLESAGFRISPADRLRVVQLLDTMGNECLENPKKLRLLLAPILARSAAEQAKFYEVFEQWLPVLPASDKPTKGTRRLWLITALLVVLSACAVWYFTRPAPPPPVLQEETTRSDTTKIADNNTVPEQTKGADAENLKPQLPIKELLFAKELETPWPSRRAWSLLLIFMASAIGAWWKWSRRPNPSPGSELPALGRKDFAFGEIADAPPYTIPFRGQEAYIRTGREQYRLADAMRQRQQGEHLYMDVPLSVQATLDRGGFPTLRFRMRRQPADYLCIIDEKHRQSHLTRLFRFFAEHIRGQDVALEIFQSSSTLDRFWNAQYPGGLTLDQLQRLFPAHRLLVFGDAHALLDVATEGLARVRPVMGAAFRRWRQRLLLTPNAPATWTFEEKALYDLFAIFPATLQGMSDAAQYIETSISTSADDEVPLPFARWREWAQQRDQDPHDHRYTRWRDAADHEAYLAGRPDLLRWLQALAVYPSPTWEITLAIGQGLEKQGVVVRPDDLLILSRIGWLQTGKMPPALREELLADLPQAAETAARLAAIEALEAARFETGNGYAGIELGVNVAIQEFALAPKDPEKQEALRLLFEAGRVNKAQEQVADMALARQMQRRNAMTKGGGDMEPPSVRDFLKEKVEEKPEVVPSKEPFFSRRIKFVLGLALTAAGLAGLMYLLWLYAARFPQEKEKRNWVQQNLIEWEVKADSATIWNNLGVSAWNERKDTSEAYEMLYRAFKFRAEPWHLGMDENLASFPGGEMARINIFKLDYNVMAAILNQQFAKLKLPPENLKDFQQSPEIWFGEEYKAKTIDSIMPYLDSGLHNDALNALGLAHLYRFQRDSAEECYHELIRRDSAYFINLHSLRPNLETLLKIQSNRIINVEAELDAGGRLRGTIYFQLKDSPIPRPDVQLIVELLNKNGDVLASNAFWQPTAAIPINKAFFVLPADLKTRSFVADSIRITLSLPNRNEAAVWNTALHFEWKPGSKPNNSDSPLPGVTQLLLTNTKTRPALNDPSKFGLRQIKGIVLHWTANEASAKQNRDYFELSTGTGSAHYIVDEQTIVQCIPDNEIALHVGSPRYTAKAQALIAKSGLLNPNYFTLGVEMCDSDKGVRDWPKTYQNTVNFVRELLKNYGLTANDLYRHSELVVGKECPKKFLDDKVWEQFKKDVAAVQMNSTSVRLAQESIKQDGESQQPEADTDGDGVPDREDKCPNEKGDKNNGGCPPSGGGLSDGGDSKRGNLYLLAIGPSYSGNSSLGNVHFTRADAESIAHIFETQNGKIFNKVDSRLLTGSEATKKGISQAVEAFVPKDIRANDVVLLFISSLAKSMSQNSLLILADDYNDKATETTTVEYSYILDVMSRSNCKKMIWIDACFSGAANSTSIPVEKHEKQEGFFRDINDLIVITSSNANQATFEDPAWGHGAFTKAILDGLSGTADLNNDALITVDELFKYIGVAVPKMVNSKNKLRQTPEIRYIGLTGDLPIFKVDKSAKE